MHIPPVLRVYFQMYDTSNMEGLKEVNTIKYWYYARATNQRFPGSSEFIPTEYRLPLIHELISESYVTEEQFRGKYGKDALLDCRCNCCGKIWSINSIPGGSLLPYCGNCIQYPNYTPLVQSELVTLTGYPAHLLSAFYILHHMNNLGRGASNHAKENANIS